MKRKILLGIALALFSSQMYSQAAPDYNGGLKVKLNEEGSSYFRLITWAQVQASHNNSVAEDQSKTNFNLRRARLILYAQISDDFLILTHLGLNSLNANNLTPTGTASFPPDTNAYAMFLAFAISAGASAPIFHNPSR